MKSGPSVEDPFAILIPLSMNRINIDRRSERTNDCEKNSIYILDNSSGLYWYFLTVRFVDLSSRVESNRISSTCYTLPFDPYSCTRS